MRGSQPSFEFTIQENAKGVFIMKITGVLPALITPVKSDGSINEKAARGLIRRLSECGADGFYILGSTGEGILMEKKDEWRCARSQWTRQRVKCPLYAIPPL